MSMIIDNTTIEDSCTLSGLNASTVPYLDSLKTLQSSAVTPTQLSYVDATSSIQTQLDGKEPALGYTPVNKAGDTMNGALSMGGNDLTGVLNLQSSSGNYGLNTDGSGFVSNHLLSWDSSGNLSAHDISTTGIMTVGGPGNDQNFYFGGTNAGIYWSTSGASINYSVGSLNFSAVSAPNSMFLQSTSGFLGLGTTSPNYRLDVNGEGNFNGNQIHTVADPSLAQDAATKNYVDTGLGTKQNTLTIGDLTSTPSSDGITITGGSGAIIGSGTSVSQHVSDSTHNGYLSSSDWSTFNNKLSSTGTGLLEQLSGDIEVPANKTYTLSLAIPYAGTINTLKIQTSSGTCTAAININGTPVTGISSVSVTSSLATATASAANTFSANDAITLVVTSAALAQDLAFTLKLTRA